MLSKIPVKRALPIIRVFVSSTFSDLKHERNALHAKVWPELERYCQQRRFTFQAIDLRWGVPAEAGLDHRTMRICFEELRRSQETSPEPNFLILLGNRYGWRPLPEVISVEEFEKLKTAAQQIQSEPVDPAKQLTDQQTKLLKRAVNVLDEWYLLDENAKPFGEKFPIGEYILRSRKPFLNRVNYGKNLDTNGKLQDTPEWLDVQFVLWSIVNLAFPATDLAGRFQTLHETSPGTFPSSVRFQSSATEQEIWQGALQVANADRHVIAAVREIVDLDAFPNRPRQCDFIDLKDDRTPDDNARQALADLKAELERHMSCSRIIRLTCQWAIDQDKKPTGDITTSHLDNFCCEILERFKSLIDRRIKEYWEPTSPEDSTSNPPSSLQRAACELEIERDKHQRFAGERAPEHTFVGREDELQRILEYVKNNLTSPLVVYGASGCGKTALLARAAQKAAELLLCRDHQPVFRFIGVTPDSSDLRSLLTSTCQELRQRTESQATGEISTDINELIHEFQSHLLTATADAPVILFLDALDQLSDADSGRRLHWIPSGEMPSHTKLIVSCLSDRDGNDPAGEPYAKLKRRNLIEKHGMQLTALSLDDAKKLLFDCWLLQANRSVNDDQRRLIERRLESDTCRQPLYLKLLFEEAKLWRSYDLAKEPGDGVPALLEQLFDRLCQLENHGPSLVNHALGYLAAARRGLSETEILEVLFADREFRRSIVRTSIANKHRMSRRPKRIPIAYWSRLRSELAPYLTERSAPGGNVLTPYHRQVAECIKACFIDQSDWKPHERLAEFFTKQNYFNERDEEQRSDVRRPVNLRKVDELLWQCVQSHQYDRAAGLLQDLDFLSGKIEAGLVNDLLNDYQCVQKDSAHRRSLDPWHEFAQSNAQVFGEHPELVFQQACNEAKGSPVSLAAWKRWERRFETPSVFAPPVAFLERTNRPDEWFPAACRLTLAGHEKSVGNVALSADGNTLVSGSSDGTVKVWDVWTGQCRRTISGHAGANGSGSVTLSGDGNTLAFTSVENTIAVFDIETGEHRPALTGHQGRIYRVSLSGDGISLVSGSGDNSVKFWNAVTGKCIETFTGHETNVRHVALSEDGTILVSESYQRVSTIKVWNVKTRECHDLTVTGPQDSVCGLALSADGRTLAAGLKNKTVKVWDIQTGECCRTLTGHTETVLSVALSADGATLASGSMDRTIKVWDVQTGDCRKTLTGHAGWVLCVALSADGTMLVSGADDKTIRVWDVSRGECPPSRSRHNDEVLSVALSPERATLATGSKDKTIKVWDVRTGVCRQTFSGQRLGILSVALSQDGTTLLSASEDGTIKVWDIASGECRRSLLEHKAGVYSIALSKDGSTLFSGSWDKTIKVWDVSSGECRRTVNAHPDGAVLGIALTADETTLVSGSFDKTIKVWDVGTWECRQILSGHQQPVFNVAVSADGAALVSSGGWGDKTCIVWDVETGKGVDILDLAPEEASLALDRVVRGTPNAWRVEFETGYVQLTLFSEKRPVQPMRYPGVLVRVEGESEGRHVLAFSRSGEAWHFRRHDRDDPAATVPGTSKFAGATDQNA